METSAGQVCYSLNCNPLLVIFLNTATSRRLVWWLAFMFSSGVVLTSFTLTILPIPFLWWLYLSSCLGRNSSSITTIFVRNFTVLVIELAKVSLPDYCECLNG